LKRDPSNSKKLPEKQNIFFGTGLSNTLLSSQETSTHDRSPSKRPLSRQLPTLPSPFCAVKSDVPDFTERGNARGPAPAKPVETVRVVAPRAEHPVDPANATVRIARHPRPSEPRAGRSYAAGMRSVKSTRHDAGHPGNVRHNRATGRTQPRRSCAGRDAGPGSGRAAVSPGKPWRRRRSPARC